MKIAFMYAGQGAQKVGMGQDLYENCKSFADTIDRASLDFDAKTLMFEGPMETLSTTRYTQPCMALMAAGITNALYEAGIKPDVACGLSLGEYSALYSAGVWDEKTFVDLVAFRGQQMEAAAEAAGETKMSAIMGLASDKLAEVCEKVAASTGKYVTVSNFNCTGQYVICGEVEAVEAAEVAAKEAGAKRAIALKVSGPFHTKYMKSAGDALAEKFSQIEFKSMEVPVIFNCTAAPLAENDNIADMLVKQVQSSIYMENTIKYLKSIGVDTVVEIGPGKTLSGFVGKTVDGITCYVVEDIAGLENVIENLK